RLTALLGGEEQAEEDLAERATPSTMRQRSGGEAGVVVRGYDGDVGDLYTKLARCCTPVPGDEIMGFVTRGGGISVHRVDCTNAGGPSASSTWRGRCRRARCSSWPSRPKPSTGTGC